MPLISLRLLAARPTPLHRRGYSPFAPTSPLPGASASPPPFPNEAAYDRVAGCPRDLPVAPGPPSGARPGGGQSPDTAGGRTPGVGAGKTAAAGGGLQLQPNRSDGGARGAAVSVGSPRWVKKPPDDDGDGNAHAACGRHTLLGTDSARQLPPRIRGKRLPARGRAARLRLARPDPFLSKARPHCRVATSPQTRWLVTSETRRCGVEFGQWPKRESFRCAVSGELPP
jgi:hypothetical protein